MATTMPQPASKRTYTNLETALLDCRRSLTTLLGSQEKADAFVVEILNMGRKAPDLHTCSMQSIQEGVVRIAALQLNPAIPNEVFLIPRGGKAEPQIGYGGLRKLVLRSPEVLDCFARDVREHDTYVPPASPVALPVHQLPGAFAPRGRVIGYYALIQLHCGNWRFWPMSVAEVEKHRDQYASKTQRGECFGSWSRGNVDREGLSSFDKMALKTCIRMACNPRDFSLTEDVTWALEHDATLGRPAVDVPRQAPFQEGQRPLVLPQQAGGMTMTDLLDGVAGDQAGIQATLARERQPVRATTQHAPAQTRTAVNPVTGEIGEEESMSCGDEGSPTPGYPGAQERPAGERHQYLCLQIDALHAAHGHDLAWRQAYWAQMCRRFRQTGVKAFTEAQLLALVDEVAAQYSAKTSVARPVTSSVPQEEPDADERFDAETSAAMDQELADNS
jgi:phage RecT family recombinase